MAGLQIAPHRLLGLAFASADLLLDVGPDGKIAFAVGVASVLAGDAELSLIGRKFSDFAHPDDQPVIDALFAGAESGARQGPVSARLAGARPQDVRAFALSACKLPQNNGLVSCALVRSAPPTIGPEEGGLHDREGFERVTRSLFETARATGHELELAFVEMEGLAEAAGAQADTGAALRTKIAGALRAQSHGGAAAARLDDDRYALVRGVGESPDVLTARLEKLMTLVEAADVRPASRAMALKGDVSPSQIVRALRYALDDFIEGGVDATLPHTLQDAVGESVRHTLRKATALGVAVAERKFTLVFQPVVGLKSGELHHYEVLVRFGEDASPFPMIRMAEELDLIEDLDMAIVQQAAAEMVADPKLSLAVNVSGRTIISPGFISRIADLVKGMPTLKRRLMFEITESAAIEDMGLANRHIQVMRNLGCQVCLDDFGAGAASLAYLQQLHLDLVKIDGRFIRELQHGGRESTFIRHLVKMCGELKVQTVAEMVETREAEDAVRQAGVDFGQGWLYGAASPRPDFAPPNRRPIGPSAARRKGVTESWG